MIFLGASAFFALALLVHDRVVAVTRELVILNRSESVAKLTLPHGETLQLEQGQTARASLGEGTHRLQLELAGASPRPVEVVLAGNVLDRLLGGRVFLLNVDAAAPVLWEETIYGPVDHASPPTPARIEMGEFLVFQRVDDLFAPFPDQGPDGPRVRIGVAPGKPSLLLGALSPDARRSPGALRYAEHHLSRDPDDEELLRLYARGAAANHAPDAIAFLSTRLAERPLRVLWHRASQDLRRGEGQLEALRQEYAAACAKEPESASLLALAARLQDDPDQALAGYRKALGADPQDPFAHYGVAVHLFRRANYSEARSHVDVACRARPGDSNFGSLRYLIRCGQKEWPLLASELERALKTSPTSFSLHQRYLEALVACGQNDEARAAGQSFRQRLSDREDPRQLALLAGLSLHALEGRWEDLQRGLPPLKDPKQSARLRFQAALGGDHLDQAGEPQGPSEVLQLALAWKIAPEGAAQAKSWRTRLAKDLGASKGAWSALAGALASADSTALSKLALSPDDKACALYLLAAETSPETRGALLELAGRYDLGRRYPHALLARARETLAGD